MLYLLHRCDVIPIFELYIEERGEVLQTSHVSRKPLQCIHITTQYAGQVVEFTICSLTEHGFLLVFSIEGKVMLYSNFSYHPQVCLILMSGHGA